MDRQGDESRDEQARAFERQLLESLVALSNGSFSQRMPAGAGVQGEVAHTLNAHLDQMAGFTAELQRVLHAMVVEGALGEQASTAGLSGAWRGMAEDLNNVSAILAGQVRDVARVVREYAAGNLSQRMAVEARGEVLAIKEGLSELADRLQELKDAVEKLVARQRALGS